MYTEDRCRTDTASDLEEPQLPIQRPYAMI